MKPVLKKESTKSAVSKPRRSWAKGELAKLMTHIIQTSNSQLELKDEFLFYYNTLHRKVLNFE
jgi:hypothetical protein